MKKPKISLDNPSVSALSPAIPLSWRPAKASRVITSPSCQRIKRCWEGAHRRHRHPWRRRAGGIDGGQPLVLHGVKVGLRWSAADAKG